MSWEPDKRKTHLTLGHVSDSTSFPLTSSDKLLKTVFGIVTWNCHSNWPIENSFQWQNLLNVFCFDVCLQSGKTQSLRPIGKSSHWLADCHRLFFDDSTLFNFLSQKSVLHYLHFSLLHTCHKVYSQGVVDCWLATLLTTSCLPWEKQLAWLCFAEIRLTHSLHGASAATAILPFPKLIWNNCLCNQLVTILILENWQTST